MLSIDPPTPRYLIASPRPANLLSTACSRAAIFLSTVLIEILLTVNPVFALIGCDYLAPRGDRAEFGYDPATLKQRNGDRHQAVVVKLPFYDSEKRLPRGFPLEP